MSGRKKLNYAAELGMERCLSLFVSKQAQATTNLRGCLLFNGSTNTDGYGQIYTKPNALVRSTGRAAQRAFLLHIVAFVAHHGQHGFETENHISHICDMRNCFNPDHLVLESAQANNARKGCPGNIVCEGCNLVVYLCPHFPGCVR